MKKIVAIYHKNCIDGTTAAAVVLRKFNDAELFPLAHDHTKEELDQILAVIDENTEVYTVDCVIGVPEILSRGFKVTAIDHHIGVKEQFSLLAKENPNLNFIFDNDRSGASLAWQYFFPYEAVPEMIRLVEDSDLWKGQYGNDTKYVNNYLWLWVNNPAKILQILDSDLDEIKQKGEVISTYAEKEINDLVELPPISLKIGEYVLKAYNITNHVSACGNILAERNEEAAVMFTIKGSEVKFSFRSKAGQEPSSLDLARILGGSGHVLAAGARVSLKDFLEMIVI